MSLSSPIFLFCFLPLVFLLSRAGKNNKYRNILLAAAGLLFYAFGNLKDLPVLLVSVAANYAFGLRLMTSEKGRKATVALSAVFNLALLSFYKFTPHALPLGISFFTFSGLGYVIDVYRDREQGTKDFLKLLLFISFFPKLVAGPIVQYKDISGQIECRSCSPEKTESGIKRFIIGLSKKILLAGTIGAAVDAVFGSAAGDARLAWIAAIGYTLQIYYDFSGYSDMAIGISAMFGFAIPENFRHPYGASSVKEFWRKWHISLSSWFRDYLYIPLGGNRKGKARTVINKMLVFLATGIWHGASWTFVFWGLAHGVLASCEDLVPMKKWQSSKGGRILCRIYTLLAVMLLFVIFRADSLTQGFGIIGAMFTFPVTADANRLIAQNLNPAVLFATAAAALLAGNLPERIRPGRNTGRVLSLVLLVLCIFAMAKGNTTPFIYAQF